MNTSLSSDPVLDDNLQNRKKKSVSDSLFLSS